MLLETARASNNSTMSRMDQLLAAPMAVLGKCQASLGGALSSMQAANQNATASCNNAGQRNLEIFAENSAAALATFERVSLPSFI